MLGKAANMFKMSKKWGQAGNTFTKIANHHAKVMGRILGVKNITESFRRVLSTMLLLTMLKLLIVTRKLIQKKHLLVYRRLSTYTLIWEGSPLLLSITKL